MTIVKARLSSVSIEDRNFVGTVAFKSEQVSLPDGSKMALGIDDGIWVLIHEKPQRGRITCYEYDNHEGKLLIDKKQCGREMLAEMCRLINYFIENAHEEDLVTIFPPERFK